MSDQRWIVIPNWDRFQHYKDRDPPWIKLYPQLLDDPDFLELTAQQRSVLVGLWMLYAKTSRKLPENTAWTSRKLGQRVTKRTLDALQRKGFIEISASKPLAECSRNASPETETEVVDPTVREGSTRSGNQADDGSAEAAPSPLPPQPQPPPMPTRHNDRERGIVARRPRIPRSWTHTKTLTAPDGTISGIAGRRTDGSEYTLAVALYQDDKAVAELDLETGEPHWIE